MNLKPTDDRSGVSDETKTGKIGDQAPSTSPPSSPPSPSVVKIHTVSSSLHGARTEKPARSIISFARNVLKPTSEAFRSINLAFRGREAGASEAPTPPTSIQFLPHSLDANAQTNSVRQAVSLLQGKDINTSPHTIKDVNGTPLLKVRTAEGERPKDVFTQYFKDLERMDHFFNGILVVDASKANTMIKTLDGDIKRNEYEIDKCEQEISRFQSSMENSIREMEETVEKKNEEFRTNDENHFNELTKLNAMKQKATEANPYMKLKLALGTAQQEKYVNELKSKKENSMLELKTLNDQRRLLTNKKRQETEILNSKLFSLKARKDELDNQKTVQLNEIKKTIKDNGVRYSQAVLDKFGEQGFDNLSLLTTQALTANLNEEAQIQLNQQGFSMLRGNLVAPKTNVWEDNEGVHVEIITQMEYAKGIGIDVDAEHPQGLFFCTTEVIISKEDLNQSWIDHEDEPNIRVINSIEVEPYAA